MILGDAAADHKATLSKYSTAILEQLTSIVAGALLVSYSMYTFFTNNYYMMLTIPFVAYGLFRYLFLVHRENFGGEPEKMFKDRHIVWCPKCGARAKLVPSRFSFEMKL